MPLGSDFNVENLARSVAAMPVADAADWTQRLRQSAAGDPKLAALVEDAFVKNLKSLSLYADMISGAASRLDTGRDQPAAVAKSLGMLMPGLGLSGIEGLLRKDAAIFATLAELRGKDAHPALKFFADEAGKFSDDDFKNLEKPLRLLVQTISKAKSTPVATATRGWVGDRKAGP